MADAKGLLAFVFVILLSNVIRAYRYSEPLCETIDDHNTMFPADDPRTYYVCLPDGNPRLVECESGHLFLDTDEVYGCAPFSMSPCNENLAAIDCSGSDRDTLVRSEDPSKYWICAAPLGTPVELPCASGRGFVKNATHMGCIDWAGWSC